MTKFRTRRSRILVSVGLGAAALALAPLGGAALAQEAATLGELPPQPLDAGRCGLFLWARDASEAFIFVAYDQPAQARINLNGQERNLTRSAFDGQNVSGHFERQRYADANVTLDVDVKFDASRPVADGAIVEDGLIRITQPNGWESVTPVGGMAACRR